MWLHVSQDRLLMCCCQLNVKYLRVRGKFLAHPLERELSVSTGTFFFKQRWRHKRKALLCNIVDYRKTSKKRTRHYSRDYSKWRHVSALLPDDFPLKKQLYTTMWYLLAASFDSHNDLSSIRTFSSTASSWKQFNKSEID